MTSKRVRKTSVAAQAQRPWTPRQQAIIDQVLNFRRDRLVCPVASRAACVADEDEAYAMQDWVADRLAHPVAGWKVGAYFDGAVQKALGLSEPFYGRVFAPELRSSPAILAPHQHPGCHVEVELALQIGKRIPISGPPMSAASLAGLVSGCFPAFEIVTSSWDNRNALSGVDHVADNGGCGGLVIGEPIAAWSEIELRGQQVELLVNGFALVTRPIAVGWQDVLGAAAWLINRLKRQNIAVQAGQVIATGTLTGLTPISPGQTAIAKIGRFAEVKMSIANAQSEQVPQALSIVIPTMQRPVPLKEQIYQNLLLMFTTMNFGQRLIERDITEVLKVSRTPVREALARLASEGYIVSTGHGYRIPTVTAADIENLTEIRALLEPVAAHRGAANPGDVGIEAMAAALTEASNAHAANDPIAFSLANRAFRAGWKQRIKNEFLLDALAKTMSSLQLVRHRVMRDPLAREALLATDRELLEAFRAKDVERAVASRHKQIQEMSQLLQSKLPTSRPEPAARRARKA
ncbi:MAG: FCD domain-containing protein [Burkholderiales bacterium]|nr:FCD domain-containing protein [Burkholderiales bacterium]